MQAPQRMHFNECQKSRPRVSVETHPVSGLKASAKPYICAKSCRHTCLSGHAADRPTRAFSANCRLSTPYTLQDIRDVRIRTLSSVILFEVKIRQIHVTAGQDVDGENIPPLAKANLEELRSQVPVMPLTPSHGVCRVICCRDLQRSCCLFSIHVDRDCSATIGGVKKISSIGSRPRCVDSDVEPFSGFGPANIG